MKGVGAWIGLSMLCVSCGMEWNERWMEMMLGVVAEDRGFIRREDHTIVLNICAEQWEFPLCLSFFGQRCE